MTDSQRILPGRAALGRLSRAPQDQDAWAVAREALAIPLTSPELAAACVAAADRLLEAGRLPAAGKLARELGAVTTMTGLASPAVRAWAHVTLARLRADTDPEAAREALERAEESCLAGPAHPQPYMAAQAAAEPDWVPPEDLLARVRIERGLITPPGAADLEAVLGSWEDYASERLATVDGDRLASLCLRIRLRHGVVDPAAIRRWEAGRWTPALAPACTAHEIVPPLFTSVAEAWLAAGSYRRALDLLENWGTDARAAGDDVIAAHAAAQAVRIARRLRLEDQDSAFYALFSAKGDPRSQPLQDMLDEACRAVAVVYREPPRELCGNTDRPASWHAWWQCQVRASSGLYIQRAAVPSEGTWDAADLELDLEEMRMLEHPGLARMKQDLGRRLEAGRPDRAPARSSSAFRDVRVAVRRAALAGVPAAVRPGVPPRLLAELAFEEGQLAGLRLPQVAARLFAIAADAYGQAGDHAGQQEAERLAARLALLPDGVTRQVADDDPEDDGALRRRVSELQPEPERPDGFVCVYPALGRDGRPVRPRRYARWVPRS